jgi:hypothetical protein
MSKFVINACTQEDCELLKAELDKFNGPHAPFTHSCSSIQIKAVVNGQMAGGILAELNG